MFEQARPPAVLAGVIAAILVAVAYGPGIAAGGVLVPGDMLEAFAPWTTPSSVRPANGLLGDIVQQMYPWRAFAHAEIAAVRFPVWNPYVGGGAPFFANSQSALLFPLNVIVLWLPPEVAATATQLAKPPLAAIGVALFLRALGVGGLGCIVAGVAWGFSGPMVAWLGWPHTNALLLVPFCFWTATRWLQSGALKWWVGHAATVGVQLLGGHPETTAHTLVVLGVFVLVWLVEDAVRGNGRGWPRPWESRILGQLVSRGVGWGAAVFVGAALAGVQIIPTLAAISESITAAEREARSLAGLTLERPTVLTWIVPNFFGSPLSQAFGPLTFLNYNETMGYVGLGTLVAASVSLVPPLRRGSAGLIVLTLVAAGLTYGLPGLTELRHLPGLSHAANTRFVFFVAFGVACLAGIGVDAMVRRGSLAPFVGVVVCCFLGVAAVGWALSPNLLAPSLEGAAPLTPLGAAMVRQGELLTTAALAACWAFAFGWLALALRARNVRHQSTEANSLATTTAARTEMLSGSTRTPLSPAPSHIEGERRQTHYPTAVSASPFGGEGQRAWLHPLASSSAAPSTEVWYGLAHPRLRGMVGEGNDAPTVGREGAWRRARSGLFGTTLAACLVVLVLGFDLLLFGRAYNPVVSAETLRRVPDAVAFVLDHDPTGRVIGLGEALLPNTSMLFGLNDLRVYEPVADQRVLSFFERIDPALKSDTRSRFYLFLWHPDVDMLSLAGVRWIIVPVVDARVASEPALADAGLVMRYRDGNAAVWENPRARPRVYLSEGWDERLDTGPGLGDVARRSGPRGGPSIVEAAASTNAPIARAGGGGATEASVGGIREDPGVVDARFSPGRSEIRVDATGPSLLVVNDAYYAGWQAWVDGQSVEILHANQLFMGIPVPDGEHSVTLEYRPIAIPIGIGVTTGGLLAIAAVILIARRPRRTAAPG